MRSCVKYGESIKIMVVNDQIVEQVNNCTYLGCEVSDSLEDLDEYRHIYRVITERYFIAFVGAININPAVRFTMHFGEGIKRMKGKT